LALAEIANGNLASNAKTNGVERTLDRVLARITQH
jgi:hypothetical protein